MLKGLELVCLGKEKSFEIYYEGGKYYNAETKEEVDKIVDIICMYCGGVYYTCEDDYIEFCVHCGNFERKRFENFQEVMMWAREQNWDFLKYIPGYKPFAALSRDRIWLLKLAKSENELWRKGYQDVKPIQVETKG